MPTKLADVQQRWDRVFLIPGTSPVWEKRGFVFVPPGEQDFFAFKAPERWRVIVDELVANPLGPLSTQFLEFTLTINGSPYRPSGSIFVPPDSDLAFEIENPTKILIPEGAEFRFLVRNFSPVLFLGLSLQARFALERITN